MSNLIYQIKYSTMKIKKILLSAIVLVSLTASAQDWTNDTYQQGNQYAGYIIDIDGKKTEGFIQYADRYSMQNNINFFTEKDNKKTKIKYSSADLKEYKVADKLYHCINFSGGLMAKPIKGNLLVEDGCIKKYMWYDRDDNYLTMHKLEGETDEMFQDRMYPSKAVYYKVDDEKPVTTDYFALKFEVKMSEYVSSNAELSKKVADKEKGYGMLSILAIIEEYNKDCK